MARRRNKSEERDVAVRRVDALLGRARLELLRRQANAATSPVPDSDLPARYGLLALRVAEKYQTGLSPPQKAQLCRSCGAYRSLATSRTRLRAGRITTTCLLCGRTARRPAIARVVGESKAARPRMSRPRGSGPSPSASLSSSRSSASARLIPDSNSPSKVQP